MYKFDRTYFRYKKSWGLFWAAVRNLIRSRGLYPFRDNFVVPSASQLALYQKDMINLCGLQNELIGKPGQQTKATELWLNAKKSETDSPFICVSVSIDGKKISVTESGVEDMAGLGNTQTREEELSTFDKELSRLLMLEKQNERKGLFSVFDSLTCLCQQIVSRLVSVEELLVKNNKLLDRNPLLSRYIYVLKCQLSSGEKHVNNLGELQSYLVRKIAIHRDCEYLLPVKKLVNLENQANYVGLFDLNPENERKNLTLIRKAKKNAVVLVSWPYLLEKLNRSTELIPRSTETYKSLVDLCYLASGQVFSSCGMGKIHPVKDIKQIYNQAHSMNSSILSLPTTDPKAVKTFCSIIAPMAFGKNCIIHEAGIIIKNGIFSDPDLLVYSNHAGRSRAVEYTVRVMKKTSVFTMSPELIASCTIDSYICKAAKGTIFLSCNNTVCVALIVPLDNNLAEDMLAFGDAFIKKEKCITKRNPENIKKIKDLEMRLLSLQKNITILGCYPILSTVINPSEENNDLMTETSFSQNLADTLKEVRSFMAKKAKELIALNVSDLSGNSSRTPHTLLAATYLTSSSLKVVGPQCISDVCEMLETNNAEVLNIGVDGESLQMATILPDGSAGTSLALVKHINDKLKEVKKDRLAELAASNPNIRISSDPILDDLEEEEIQTEYIDSNDDTIRENILETVALIENGTPQLMSSFTVEDLEDLLGDVTEEATIVRKKAFKALKLAQLRIICLKYVLPRAKKMWLLSALGRENLLIKMSDGSELIYTPNSICQKTKAGHFRTINFDYAHIQNLFREHASKGKLAKLGLTSEKLQLLASKPNYEYLKKIIALKGNKLMFDSMNQTASSLLFSEKTSQGLADIGDKSGSYCVKVIGKGLSALDSSGMSSEIRIRHIILLKKFIEDNSNLIERLKRPTCDLSNELLQMVLTTIDGYFYTSLNMQFFNIRRKGK